jgi:phage tail protein X
MIERVLTSIAGDTADLIALRVYGRTAGATEAILDLNPGLAALGATIPLGTKINLPSLLAAADAPAVTRLWD